MYNVMRVELPVHPGSTPVIYGKGYPDFTRAAVEAVSLNRAGRNLMGVENFYYPAPAAPAPVAAPEEHPGNLTLTVLVDAMDPDLGQVRLMGNRDLPVELVAAALRTGLMRECGYRSLATLAAEGWEFDPDGPAFWDGEGVAEDAAWVWDYNRADAPAPASYNRP